MVKRNEIYKCIECGNVIEVTSVGGGQLVCEAAWSVAVRVSTPSRSNNRARTLPSRGIGTDGKVIECIGRA
jgi:desulfoferrodoxin-like iron-binding protein